MGDQLLLEGQANDKIKNVMVTCHPDKDVNKFKAVELNPSILSLDNTSDYVSSQSVDHDISFGDFKRELNDKPAKMSQKRKV